MPELIFSKYTNGSKASLSQSYNKKTIQLKVSLFLRTMFQIAKIWKFHEHFLICNKILKARHF